MLSIRNNALTAALSGLSCMMLLSGCATSALIHKDNKVYSTTTKVTLVEDSVVAFGKPAQSVSNLPSDSLVIAGQKNSYVLTQGGSRFLQLLNVLDPKNIQINKELNFHIYKLYKFLHKLLY